MLSLVTGKQNGKTFDTIMASRLDIDTKSQVV